MFWAIAAALAGVVAVAIVAPFLRPVSLRGGPPAAAYDLRVYRSQLAEVDRDLARGIIAEGEAARLRTEIGRKVLDADRALAGAGQGGAGQGGAGRPLPPVAMAAAVVAMGIGAFLLYQRIGVPQMPDEPFAARVAAAEQTYQNRPDQAAAEADAALKPRLPQPAPDAEYLQLIEQLRAAVAKRPDDKQGLALLAEHEARLGNAAAAAAAMSRLIALEGSAASAEDHARLAGLMVEAAGGLITRESEAELAKALALDPGQPQARYMQGLLMIQNRRPDRAFPIWRELLEKGPADAPWTPSIRRAIGDLAWFAGQPDYQPPAEGAAPAMPGPDAAAMAAAENMSDADRQQMIRGMVSGLEERLASQGGTPQEWARLIGALKVLGEGDRAQAILTEARSRFAAVPDARAVIEEAAATAGLK